MLTKLNTVNTYVLGASSALFFGFLTVAFPEGAILSYTVLILFLLYSGAQAIFDILEVLKMGDLSIFKKLSLLYSLGRVVAVGLFFVVGIIIAF